jgi:hypothetical protein
MIAACWGYLLLLPLLLLHVLKGPGGSGSLSLQESAAAAATQVAFSDEVCCSRLAMATM